MKRYIVGEGVFAETLLAELEQGGIDVAGFVVESDYLHKAGKASRPVYALESIKGLSPSEEVGVYMCIGYRQMNAVREKLYRKVRGLGFSVLSFVHPSAQVLSSEIGTGNLIFEGAIIGAHCRIGDCNVFYPKAMLAHHSTCGNFNFFAISSSVAGCVTIGDRCFFGNNSCCKDHIRIANMTLVGASAFLDHDSQEEEVVVPPRSVVLSKKSQEVF